MRPKAQSAPADRGGVRTFKKFGKSNSAKEIENWASAGRDMSNAERNSGQLTDNVTEERMLHSRLRDLSKERQKFISQKDYERKIFLDRQTRKSPVFKELIHSIAPDGRLSKSRARSGNNSNARMRMLDRFDPTKAKKKVDIEEAAKTSRDNSLMKGPTALPERRHSFSESQTCNLLAKANGKTFPTESKIGGNNRLVEDVVLDEREEQLLEGVLPKLQTTSTTAAVRFADHSPPVLHKSTATHAGQKGILKDKRKKWCKNAVVKTRESSPISDPRYRRLESSLSKAHGPMDGYGVDLPLIISQIGSLHISPVHSKDQKKPRITIKIQEFMAERGIIF